MRSATMHATVSSVQNDEVCRATVQKPLVRLDCTSIDVSQNFCCGELQWYGEVEDRLVPSFEVSKVRELGQEPWIAHVFN